MAPVAEMNMETETTMTVPAQVTMEMAAPEVVDDGREDIILDAAF